MIHLLFDTATQTVKLAIAAVVKIGADVPVTITFSAAPGEISALALALGTDATTPEVKAFTDDFAAENETVWTALLDANDTRLIAFMASKGTTVMKLEVIAVIDGRKVVTPNLDVTVQKAIVTGPESSEGGPSYYTQAEVDALLAAIPTVSAAGLAALNLSTLPTANPGGGKLWLNGGVLQVGA